MNNQQPGNAWVDAEERYKLGQEVRGTVTRVAQFGVFVQIEPDIEGIVYAFELGSGPLAVAGFAAGQEIQLHVKSVDASRRRLELSLGNNPLPGLLDEHTFPPTARRKRQFAEQSWPVPPLLPDILLKTSETSSPVCPTCQRQVQRVWKFCVYCSGSLQRHCSDCGSVQPDLPDARYCHECGKPL